MHEAHPRDGPARSSTKLADDGRGVEALEGLRAGQPAARSQPWPMETIRPLDGPIFSSSRVSGAAAAAAGGSRRGRRRAAAGGRARRAAAEPALRREQPHDLVGVQRSCRCELQQRAHQRLRRSSCRCVAARASAGPGWSRPPRSRCRPKWASSPKIASSLGSCAGTGVVVAVTMSTPIPPTMRATKASSSRDAWSAVCRSLITISSGRSEPARAGTARPRRRARSARGRTPGRPALGQTEALAQLRRQADDPAGAGAQRGAQLVVGGAAVSCGSSGPTARTPRRRADRAHTTRAGRGRPARRAPAPAASCRMPGSPPGISAPRPGLGERGGEARIRESLRSGARDPRNDLQSNTY